MKKEKKERTNITQLQTKGFVIQWFEHTGSQESYKNVDELSCHLLKLIHSKPFIWCRSWVRDSCQSNWAQAKFNKIPIVTYYSWFIGLLSDDFTDFVRFFVVVLWRHRLTLCYSNYFVISICFYFVCFLFEFVYEFRF